MFTGFPEHWTTLKKLMFAVGSGIIGGASAIWKTVTGTLIHITDALASPMQKCEVTIEPLQSGSGDPSPTNVRPITGWTGATIYHRGKNLLNAVSENILRYSSSYGNYTFADGVVTITGKTLMGFKCQVKPNTTYTVAYRKSNTVDQVAVRVREFSQEPTGWESTGFIEQSVNTNHTVNNDIGARFTTTAQTTWLIVAIYRSGAPSETLTVSKWSLVLGEHYYIDVIESYEPYNGTTYPISWQTEAGTVYGGTLDVVNGTLKSTIKKDTWNNNSTIELANTGTYCCRFRLRGGTAVNPPVPFTRERAEELGWHCNMAVFADTWDVDGKYAYTTSNSSGSAIRFFSCPKTYASTVAELKAKLAETPIEIVCYASSTEYALTPQEISTLAGENNIWADAGDMEITYKAQA